MYFVLGLLIIVAILFALDKIRPDYIALAALTLLILVGTLTPSEALKAFGNTTVVLVAFLFIIGQGLTQTGITQLIGDTISLKVKPGQDNKLISLIMSSVAFLSSFMSSTGVVALFVPVVQKIAANNKINIRRLLIPVAYGGLIGGMLSLIATPPNLIVSEELRNQGYEPFSMLSFTPIGLVVLSVAIVYFIIINKSGKKKKTSEEVKYGEERMKELLGKYNLRGEIYRVKLSGKSTYIGKRISETEFRQIYDVNILGIEVSERVGHSVSTVTKDTLLHKGDILYIQGIEKDVRSLSKEKNLTLLPYLGAHQGMLRQQMGLAEVIVPYNSNYVGFSLDELGRKYLSQLNILGSKRIKTPTLSDIKSQKLNEGDTMLVLGSKDEISSLRENTHDLIVFNMPFEEKLKVNKQKAFTALTITVLMIVFLVINIIPPVLTVMIASLAMIGTRCLTMEEAYQSISWSTVILIAAMLPFATALDKTGGIALIVDGIMGWIGDGGPYLLISGLFFVTVLLSSFISNTATAVILAPIAISIAENAGISPYPLVMTVAIAASTAYLTPVASPVNMLVVSPGGYRFMDFMRTGFPLFIVTWVICLFLIPLVFPI